MGDYIGDYYYRGFYRIDILGEKIMAHTSRRVALFEFEVDVTTGFRV